MSTYYEFYRPPAYNTETKFQLWTTAIIDFHDTWCSCCRPIAHLLSGLFPPDHQDYNKTIQQILHREYNTPICHFGGQEEKGGGEAETGLTTREDIKEKNTEEEEGPNIEDLIAAAEEAEKR